MAVSLMGATYQGIATSLERRAHPRPGRLVDVGTHQLHIWCTGAGTPTVVLEAAGGELSVGWANVQAAASGFTRVCSYDRAGLGWSEAGAGSFEPTDVPRQLGLLLRGANEAPPYVVVGHGLGAPFAMLFAAYSPRLVAALVLVESTSGTATPLEGALAELGGAAAWLARFGLLRITPLLTRHVRAEGPSPPARAVRAFLNRPDHLSRAVRELARAAEVEDLSSHAALGGVSVSRVVLDSDRDHAFLADSDSRQVVAAIERAVLAARPSPSGTTIGDAPPR
jgi:pimeloyl-ACP methyl ester carboxylesterase